MACVLNFQSHWPSVPPPMGWCDRWLAGSLLGNLASGGLAGTPGYRGACWDTCGRQHTWHTAQGLGTHLLPTYLCTYLSTHLPTSIYLPSYVNIYLPCKTKRKPTFMAVPYRTWPGLPAMLLLQVRVELLLPAAQHQGAVAAHRRAPAPRGREQATCEGQARGLRA